MKYLILRFVLWLPQPTISLMKCTQLARSVPRPLLKTGGVKSREMLGPKADHAHRSEVHDHLGHPPASLPSTRTSSPAEPEAAGCCSRGCMTVRERNKTHVGSADFNSLIISACSHALLIIVGSIGRDVLGEGRL